MKLTLLEPIVVVVVLTLAHGYNAVRGHRTGSNNSGAENYLRRKTMVATDGETAKRRKISKKFLLRNVWENRHERPKVG